MTICKKAETLRVSERGYCRAAVWVLLVMVVEGCRSVGYRFKLKDRGTAPILISDTQIVDHVRGLSRDVKRDYSSYLQPEFHGSPNSNLVRRVTQSLKTAPLGS